ncbi:MAG: bifunctional [glutamate--ammonia ligase]-adenylyl-L-tyrosine phosphorylase/[glutamate--ammonia-ligase] adenylyltransferase [Candidatus Competibacteraceae bacterium]
MSVFQSVLTQLPPALQENAATHWQDFLAAATHASVTPPADAAVLTQLVRVWACSDFVARACARDPAMLHELLNSGDLAGAYPSGRYATRLAELLQSAADEDQLSTRLRRFRNREMVRIAWRDLVGAASLEETLGDLSDLADAVTDGALEKLYGWQCERFGTPRNAQGEAQRLIVLGMGKLGGRELNYSSDIDLIFVFPQPGETDGRRSVGNEEFFRRLGQSLIKQLQQRTAEGFVFRVDMRLRPFGESGPLVMPAGGFVDYYQNHGREWERYALIKARVIAGDHAAGAQLLEQLRPFVYRRYLDYGAFEELRTMKAMIAKEVQRKGLLHNIKLGPGGIREIEFIGQVFQLIYGGREPTLRERSILKVLDRLAAMGRLPTGIVAELKQAYAFLRRTENRLQAWADQQTQLLPEGEPARLRLAYAMGFVDWIGFAEALQLHQERVSSQFALIFATPPVESPEPTATTELDFTALWRGDIGTDDAVRFLQEQGFEEPVVAWEKLQDLKQSLSYRSLSRRGRDRMDRLLPRLLDTVRTMAAPTVALERLLQLLETIARRSVYLALLGDNPRVLSQLVRLCSASVWIGQHLARYPLLLDELLDPNTLYRPPEIAKLGGELEAYLERAGADDTEQLLDALRHFKHTHVLRVAAADVSDALPLMIVSDHLTAIAEVLLRKVLELAWADLTPRYGRPTCVEDGRQRQAGFAIVAYGKLGGIELNYGSDLDLVFLHDSAGERQVTTGPHELDNPTFFARLVQRIIYWLTTRTGAGELYEVDTRLRPSGRAGLLVSSTTAFADYQRHQAWTWEHQALVRARVVAGPTDLAAQFGAIRREVLSRERDPVKLRQEVRDMRERMRRELGSNRSGEFDLKQDRGGIADIEFMVQYEVLANAHRYPDLLRHSDNIRQLAGLEHYEVLSSADASGLRAAYRGLRRILHRLTLQGQPGRVPIEEVEEYRRAVTALWHKFMEVD